MLLQELESINKGIESVVKRSPDIYLTTLYKKFRDNPKISLYGDIPFLCHLITYMIREFQRKFTHYEFTSALNKCHESNFFSKKEKSCILQLFEQHQKDVTTLSKVAENSTG